MESDVQSVAHLPLQTKGSHRLPFFVVISLGLNTKQGGAK